MKIELSSCGSKYYKKMQMDAMLITSLRDHNKIYVYEKTEYCVFEYIRMFFLLKQREKKSNWLKISISILQFIF